MDHGRSSKIKLLNVSNDDFFQKVFKTTAIKMVKIHVTILV